MIDANKIEEVKKRLIQTYNPLEIYIFGSYAWGHPDEESDLDLLIVVNTLDEEEHVAVGRGYGALFGLGISKDIIILTKDEFERRAQIITNLWSRVKREGRLIYAKS